MHVVALLCAHHTHTHARARAQATARRQQHTPTQATATATLGPVTCLLSACRERPPSACPDGTGKAQQHTWLGCWTAAPHKHTHTRARLPACTCTNTRTRAAAHQVSTLDLPQNHGSAVFRTLDSSSGSRHELGAPASSKAAAPHARVHCAARPALRRPATATPQQATGKRHHWCLLPHSSARAPSNDSVSARGLLWAQCCHHRCHHHDRPRRTTWATTAGNAAGAHAHSARNTVVAAFVHVTDAPHNSTTRHHPTSSA
jgi:hypothetical protein